MDLALTDEQKAYRSRARRWITENLPRQWGGLYRGPEDPGEFKAFQIDWCRKLHAAGYAGIWWPKEYGGQGLTLVEHLIVCEELGRVAAPEAMTNIGTEMVGPLLLGVGTEEQKRRFIPRILTADDIWCQGFSEPSAGSDLAALKTKAIRDDDGFRVSGQKLWTSRGHQANWCVLLARTNSEVPKHKGLSLLMMDMSAPGISVRPVIDITGKHEFNEVFLDDVHVPAANVIGTVDNGWEIANKVLSHERGTNRMYRQARFQHEFRHLLKHAVAQGRLENVAKNPLGVRVGKAYCDLFIHRLHNWKLAARIVNKDPIGVEISFVKLFWSVAHQDMTGLGIDLLGPEAVTEGPSSPAAGRFQDLYLQARGETIYAGTVQIQRNIIAERVLGLPR